jgi:hypothetical protein
MYRYAILVTAKYGIVRRKMHGHAEMEAEMHKVGDLGGNGKK